MNKISYTIAADVAKTALSNESEIVTLIIIIIGAIWPL
jgi:hypothetical protein